MPGRFDLDPTKKLSVPSIEYDAELQALLSQADRKMGRLDGIIQFLPNAELFAAMYVKKEAVLSSQLDGANTSFGDVLSAQCEQDEEPREDIKRIVSYEKAINWGLSQLEKVPLSARLIESIQTNFFHSPKETPPPKKPGRIRRALQMTPSADNPSVRFVADMEAALGEMDDYFSQDDATPALVKIALLHAEFEMIHPWRDGGSRMGRLLIPFWLRQKQVLSKPLFYLSYYFKQNKTEYNERLAAVHKLGDWTGWIKFFLKGVAEVADEAVNSASAIIRLKEELTQKLLEKDSGNTNYQKLLNYLFEQPFVKRSYVTQLLGVSNPTAGSIIDTFCQLGILTDRSPGRHRNKTYAFSRYLEILEKGTEPE